METTEFNPTAKDLFNLDEKIIELKANKQKLIGSKISVEGSLSILANKYNKVEFGGTEFYKIKDDRQKLKTEANQIEMKIRKINEEIAYKVKLKQEIEFHLKGKKASVPDDKVVRQLKNLKEKYNSFAKDKTRVSSMRIMASEFRDELEEIINLL